MTNQLTVAAGQRNLRSNPDKSEGMQLDREAREAFDAVVNDIPATVAEPKRLEVNKSNFELRQPCSPDRKSSTGKQTPAAGWNLRRRPFLEKHDQVTERTEPEASAKAPALQERDPVSIYALAPVVNNSVTLRNKLTQSVMRHSSTNTNACTFRDGQPVASGKGEQNAFVDDDKRCAKIEVLDQQTHFAPVATAASLSVRTPIEKNQIMVGTPEANPEQSETIAASVAGVDSSSRSNPIWSQVANATMTALLSPPDEAEDAGRATRAQTTNGMNQSPVRIVKLQLTPETLGTIDVVLSTSKDGLKVRLDAHIAEVAGKLRADSTLLSERLETCGHRVAELSVVSLGLSQDLVATTDRVPDVHLLGNVGTFNDDNSQSHTNSGREHRSQDRQQNGSDAAPQRSERDLRDVKGVATELGTEPSNRWSV